MWEHAKTPILNANINISANSATKLDTGSTTAWTGPNEIFGLQPKYLSPTTAEWSEDAHPLPHLPFSEVSEPAITKTITNNPHLFQVKSSIKIDVFKSMLKFHPNPIFVSLVCTRLCEGFWPWANTSIGVYPETHDELRPMV